jgi:hypothetical protein
VNKSVIITAKNMGDSPLVLRDILYG